MCYIVDCMGPSIVPMARWIKSKRVHFLTPSGLPEVYLNPTSPFKSLCFCPSVIEAAGKLFPPQDSVDATTTASLFRVLTKSQSTKQPLGVFFRPWPIVAKFCSLSTLVLRSLLCHLSQKDFFGFRCRHLAFVDLPPLPFKVVLPMLACNIPVELLPLDVPGCFILWCALAASKCLTVWPITFGHCLRAHSLSDLSAGSFLA